MMSIGRSSRRENLLWVTGIEPSFLIRTRLANHIRASSRENGPHLYHHPQHRGRRLPSALWAHPPIRSPRHRWPLHHSWQERQPVLAACNPVPAAAGPNAYGYNVDIEEAIGNRDW
jgi:hypothetical protein